MSAGTLLEFRAAGGFQLDGVDVAAFDDRYALSIWARVARTAFRPRLVLGHTGDRRSHPIAVRVEDSADGNLREEVYKTEATDWKQALKGREHLLADLLAKFRQR